MAEVKANGLTHHVQRIGEGPDETTDTVVFVHGLVMDNLSSWFFTAAPRVARENDVILYDLRGHGRSERPVDGYGIPDLVADLAAVLEAMDVERPVTLVGNSFGGLLALAFAAAHPERVASLVLVDAHVSAGDHVAHMASSLELQGPERDAVIAANFKDWLGRHSARKRNRLARTAEALVHGTSLVADLKASPALTDADLEAITCPTLALYGADSDVRALGERLASTLPACTLELIEGVGHSIIWDATERVCARIAQWVGEGR